MSVCFAKATSGGAVILENMNFQHIDKDTGSMWSKTGINASVTKDSQSIESKLNSNTCCSPPPPNDDELLQFHFKVDHPQNVSWEGNLAPLLRNQCCRVATAEEMKLFKPIIIINDMETESETWLCAATGSHKIRYNNSVYVLTYNQMYCHQLDMDGDGADHKRIHVDGHIYDLNHFE